MYQVLYCPTNALNYINCRVIKNTLKYKSCSNMFRFTQEPSSGSQSQCLAKITSMVPLPLSILTLSVLWRHAPYNLYNLLHYLDYKVLDIIDARWNHEEHEDVSCTFLGILLRQDWLFDHFVSPLHMPKCFFSLFTHCIWSVDLLRIKH